MAKFSSLQAPVTNPQASQRLADTQALRARAAVGQAPVGAPAPQTAAQTGAAITQQAGQQALQQQQQQASVAKAQAGQQLQKQRLAGQQQVFGQEQALQDAGRMLDQKLFDINQDAANREQQLRTAFANNQAQTKFLQEQELLDWTLSNAQNEQQFKDKIQMLEQAHARKAALVDHAFKVKMQDLRQREEKAAGEDKQKLQSELAQIQNAWQQEQQRRAAEAKNRQAMIGAASSALGAAGAAALVAGGVVAAPIAVPIAVGLAAAGQGSGFTESLLGGFK